MKKKYVKYRMIEATALPRTNTLPCRVKIFERPRFSNDRQKSKVFSFEQEHDNVLDQAEAVLIRSGFNIKARAEHRDAYVFLVDNWGENFIKIKSLK